MGHSQAIIVGSDCPSLTVEDFRNAAQILSTGANAAFVPTEDGGYALIGLRAVDPALFDHVPWSTDAVMCTSLPFKRGSSGLTDSPWPLARISCTFCGTSMP